MNNWRKWLLIAILAIFLVYVGMPLLGRIFGPQAATATGDSRFNIVTLLPKNAIPAINNPQFVSGAEADTQYHDEELVIGVEIDGDARAYSVPFLSGHEIVNDIVGGEPIAVTW